jgi:hypothetical protein
VNVVLAAGNGWITSPAGPRLASPLCCLAQPYGLHDIESLFKAAREFDLNVSVNGDGWCGEGTIAIEFRGYQSSHAKICNPELT